MPEPNKNDNTELSLAVETAMKKLQKNGDFEIKPYEITNIDDNPKFKKLALTSSQQIQMSAFANQLPMMAMAVNSAGNLSRISNSTFYVMELPKGLPYTLMKLKDGYGNILRGADGKFAMQMPLYPVDMVQQAAAQTAVLTTFSVMSIASGQYFLSQINSNLNVMKLNLDKILEFLYGDKKAELLSEINFTRYVYQNYNAIMQSETQRIATISSLHEARKVAIKDCEFYLVDLLSTVNDTSDIVRTFYKAFQIKENFDLALQLYVTGNLLEVYYAQNFDNDYLSYVARDIQTYIAKSEKLMVEYFTILKNNINNTRDNPFWQLKDRSEKLKKIDDTISQFHEGQKNDLYKTLTTALRSPSQAKRYYISPKGDVYIKTA